MVHVQHDDFAPLLVDAVQDTKCAASSAVSADEFVTELSAGPLWVLEQGAGDELDHCCGDSLGQLFA